MSHIFLNKLMEVLGGRWARTGNFTPNHNTEIITSLCKELLNLIDKQAEVSGMAFRSLVREEFELIGTMMIEQNGFSQKDHAEIVRDNCMPCARILLRSDKSLITALFGKANGAGKDIYLTSQNVDMFRSCCMSLTRGVPIDEALDKDGPDIDGLKLWMILGTLFCISKIIDLPDVTVH